jgi:hypothetical protein
MIGAEECHLPETVGVWDRLQGLVLRFGDTGVFCSELVARLDLAPWKTPRSAAWSGGGFCAVSVLGSAVDMLFRAGSVIGQDGWRDGLVTGGNDGG